MVELFKSKFEKAVERQLIADVDVGAFLSGGLDSSSIVAVAKQYKNNIKTFSFGFEGLKSELPYACEIAKKYNTNHYELFSNDDFHMVIFLFLKNVKAPGYGLVEALINL